MRSDCVPNFILLETPHNTFETYSFHWMNFCLAVSDRNNLGDISAAIFGGKFVCASFLLWHGNRYAIVIDMYKTTTHKKTFIRTEWRCFLRSKFLMFSLPACWYAHAQRPGCKAVAKRNPSWKCFWTYHAPEERKENGGTIFIFTGVFVSFCFH